MGVGLGSLLVSSSDSRGHESEADRYASDEDVLDYVFSQPTTKERVKIAQQYSRCIKGLTACEIVSVSQ